MTHPGALAEKIQSITVIRELFPKCYHCAGSIRETPLRDLALVEGKNRLAHLHCPDEND